MNEDEQLLSTLLKQEEVLRLTEFTNDIAFELGLRLVEAARKEGKGITIDIRRNGQQLFHSALPGTSADNDAWIVRKNRVVERFGHSSYYMGRYYASKDSTLEKSAHLPESEYAAHGGAFPVIIKNVGVVGTITVSGLPQREDHEFVVRVLAGFLGVTLPG
ncbi:MAG TPA: heme-degrading domain-containing protein [Ktedonobacterales bacterium]